MIFFPCRLIRPFAALFLVATLPSVAWAGTPQRLAFDQAAFERQAAQQEKALLNAGKLRSLSTLLGKLKSNPATAPVTFPAPAVAKLDAVDLHDKLLASTLVVGLYYHCADCKKMHFNFSGGFAVGEDENIFNLLTGKRLRFS